MRSISNPTTKHLTLWETIRLPLLLLLSGLLTTCAVSIVQAEEDNLVQLTVVVRDVGGAPVAGERIHLQRLPQEALPSCTTDTLGRCVWPVRRGLYELTFTRAVDGLTAVAAAEGGLAGLGITVGDADIIYHFTFHDDDHVYFDSTPDADIPTPVIPTEAMLHTHDHPHAEDADHTGPQGADPSITAEDSPARETLPAQLIPWRLLFFIAGGFFLGLGLHWWSQLRRQRARQTEEQHD